MLPKKRFVLSYLRERIRAAAARTDKSSCRKNANHRNRGTNRALGCIRSGPCSKAVGKARFLGKGEYILCGEVDRSACTFIGRIHLQIDGCIACCDGDRLIGVFILLVYVPLAPSLVGYTFR